MSERRGGWVAAGVASAITLAYLFAFRGYGVNFEDEGLVLYSILRVVRGELPYVDFATGYTPGYFYLHAALWRLAGDLLTFRTLLSLIHAATVGGLALATARVASPALAVVVPLLYLVFIPVTPGASCMFNVPYPGWLATLAWVAMVLALLGFVERRGRGWLVGASLAAAAALASKPNAGVFAIAAAMSVVLMVETPAGGERRSSAPLWWLAWAGIVLGPWVTLGVWPGLRDALAYLVPLSVALLALPARTRTRRAGFVGDVATLVVPFVLVSLPWLLFFWARLGTEGFLRDVLLIGSGAAQIYYFAYPPLESWGLVVAAGAVGLALLGLGLRAGRVRAWQVGMALVLGLTGGLVAVLQVGLMPESTLWSIIWQLESAAYPLVLVTQVVGIAWLWRRRAVCEVPSVLLLCALFMHLQLYPRPDFAHLITSASLTAVFAAFLLDRMLQWSRRGLTITQARVARGAAVAAIAAVILLRVSPSVAARLAEPGPPLPFDIAPVALERARSAVLEDLGSAATRLASLVPPGGPSLTFPAVDIALFLTGARNPSPVGYFFPGRPDHREEAEIVDVLVRTSPAALLSLNSAFFFFDDAPPYYFLLRRLVRGRYALQERSGRFDVLAAGRPGTPIDTTHVDPVVTAAVAGLQGRPLADVGPALIALATSAEPDVRRAALTALVDRVTVESSLPLETHVANAGLDRRREVLLLRTVRDTRDARASSYLLAAAKRPDPRIANEALGAMYVTRQQLAAARNLWAGSYEPAAFPLPEQLATTVREVLADPEAPPRATALAAHLAGVLGDASAAPLLEARLAPRGDDGATAASAAASLVRLAPEGQVCELVALLGRPESQMLVHVPTAILDLAERAEPVRGETRACLGGAIAAGDAASEPAIWIAAALADGSFASVLRAALLEGTPAVRRAAAWALGEMPSEDATAAALARSSELDPDSIVRRLADGAAAKQAGRTPRAALATPPPMPPPAATRSAA